MFTERSPLSLLQIVDKEFAHSCHKVMSGITTENAVITVGINLHIELDAGLYKSLCIFSTVLVMNIVVGSTMDKQKTAFQVCSSVYSRTGLVTVAVFLRRTP